ncbi:hypothetical protein D3C84_1122790 [compost metagenome]
MIFRNIMIEESRLTRPFMVVVIDGPMQLLAIRTIMPILRGQRCKNRMLDRQHEAATRHEAVIYLAA